MAQVFGSALKSILDAENILVLVFNSTWISIPITTSKLFINFSY
ncbi:Hypothetical protein MCYN_0323 [Mycoplasmopsis cynos C142]|uniref:Uncharacterized protein n=1 Tax=Mycoplasmopsis cynos (strain C142) TaxID=1246955 RepID=L0RWZ4_MYCC1|nr:Hypothetical protein MCYN_0323 [Mycoplasmopsis cynos C142]